MSNIIKPKVIAIKTETYQRLKEHGAMGDTFDDVMRKVLDKAEGKNTPPPRQ